MVNEVKKLSDANNQDDVLRLLDEAWELVKSNAREVRRQQDGDRTELTIDMPRRIGYVGGEQGARQNKPATSRLNLVVEGDRVITAGVSVIRDGQRVLLPEAS